MKATIRMSKTVQEVKFEPFTYDISLEVEVKDWDEYKIYADKVEEELDNKIADRLESLEDE